ncbi:MAG: DNA polymerase III subunit delta' [Pseudomonadota bacterium]
MEAYLAPPYSRLTQVGRTDLERSIRATMTAGALNHGWIISGAAGAGKATLAYRIARAALDPESLTDSSGLAVVANAQSCNLIANRAHPDLFVAERQWNEKLSKYQSDITVETVRRLTQFLNHTSAFGVARVAIVDTADDMNRNAANALLKVLEEPPRGALLLLLSAAPGRLLPTIRSRCRTLELRALQKTEITALLEEETDCSAAEAAFIAEHADGRPGYALELAAGGGAECVKLVDRFLAAAASKRGLQPVASALSGKAGDDRWTLFQSLLMGRLSRDARQAAAQGEARASAYAAAHDHLSALVRRGVSLNLDRGQLISALAHDYRACLDAS